MKRSEREFRKYFPDVAPLSSDYLYNSERVSVFSFLPWSSNLYSFSIAFREIVGIIWYRIIGITHEGHLPESAF